MTKQNAISRTQGHFDIYMLMACIQLHSVAMAFTDWMDDFWKAAALLVGMINALVDWSSAMRFVYTYDMYGHGFERGYAIFQYMKHN